MKRVALFLARWLTLPFIIALVYAPILGLIFGATVILTGLDVLVRGDTLAFGYFSLAWKAYVAFAVFTFTFLTTYDYQNCCVGINTFRGHIKHSGWKGVGGNLIASLVWPWCWFMVDLNLKGWYSSFADAVLRAFHYWLVDIRQGTEISLTNFNTGQTTIVYANSPEEAFGFIRDSLRDPPGERPTPNQL